MTLAAKRDRNALIGALLCIGRPHRGGAPETWVGPAMVRSGLMNRTWDDWGIPNGSENKFASVLLKALRAKAAGSAGEVVARLSAQIDRLATRTGLSRISLAEQLAHDVKLWKRHWETLRDLPQRKAGSGRTDKAAPFRSVPRVWAHSRYAANRRVGNTITTAQEDPKNAESPGNSGNTAAETAASAPPSRSKVGDDASGPPSQTADVLAPDQPTHADKPEGDQKTARAKRGPKPGTVARYREADAALFSAIETLIIAERMSQREATLHLAKQGKVAGLGTVESKGTRLHKAYTMHQKL